eukprot:m.245300 g.245300  ORF g.245300 m.245300 type:complete len:94 (+) comp15851_c0_seq3:2289-2570(+)
MHQVAESELEEAILLPALPLADTSTRRGQLSEVMRPQLPLSAPDGLVADPAPPDNGLPPAQRKKQKKAGAKGGGAGPARKYGVASYQSVDACG